MRIIEINALPNGAHRNQTINRMMELPDGYALIPDSMVLDNFPFGEVVAEKINGIMTVTSWTPGAIPEKKVSEKELAEREIASLKAKLTATDYQAIKYAEGVMSAEEYAPVKEQRQAWRARINELEVKYGLEAEAV